jgi:hypothetical protein
MEPLVRFVFVAADHLTNDRNGDVADRCNARVLANWTDQPSAWRSVV